MAEATIIDGRHTYRLQTIGRVFGWFFLATFITSIPAYFIGYARILQDPSLITGTGTDPTPGVATAATLEIFLIIANVATAVVAYPVLKRQSEIGAVGYLSARLVEGIFIAIGIVCLLGALSAGKSLRHVALVTGLKHYLGPFDAYVSGGSSLQTPLREEQPRLNVENFYYAQEDELFAAADRDGFGWSVHRPHTVIGKAVGNAMNLGTTLAVHAAICKETGRAFRWPGSAAQWNGISDVTDARVLARHLVWAATTDAARNQAFNVANGDVFRWNWLWPRLAGWFGIEAMGFDGTVHPLEAEMAGDGPVWREIAARHGLLENDLGRLASPWHTDLDLGRPIEVMTDMSGSRKLGFTAYQRTDESFFDLFAQLRADRLIP